MLFNGGSCTVSHLESWQSYLGLDRLQLLPLDPSSWFHIMQMVPQALTPEPALPLERYAEGVVHPSVVATHNLLLTHHLRIVYTSTCQRTMGETGGLCASFWPAVNVKSNLLLQTTRATQTSWLTSLLSWHHHHHHHEAFYLGCIVFLGMYTQI